MSSRISKSIRKKRNLHPSVLVSDSRHYAYIEKLAKDGKADEECRGDANCTLLMWACIQQKMDIVKMLLKSNVDVNAMDENLNTALKWAVSHGGPSFVEVILLSRPECQVDCQSLDFMRSPLMWAASLNDIKSAKLLLSHGADVDLQDHIGQTALMYATRWGFLDMVKFLVIEGKARTDIRNNHGKTAAEWGRPKQEIVDFLQDRNNE